MPLKRAGIVMLLGIIALSVIIAVLVLPEALPEAFEGEPAHVLVRLFGLYGFLFLGVATLITPFLKEITQAFGKPFLRIHHAFSVLGIVFITLHPVFNAIQPLNLSVFIPRFDLWDVTFWRLAGRPAFIILYIALLAAFLRAKAPKYWRPFHALMYVVLLFGIVHANLIGDDFENVGIMIIFNVLFAASIAVFVIKRFRNYARTRI
jgi:DMSO/TMAO reductase YedYZ heme-binding membrane subunit